MTDDPKDAALFERIATVGRYRDGEAAPEQIPEIATRLVADRDLRALYDDLGRDAANLKLQLDAELSARPLPPRIMQTIADGFAARWTRPRPRIGRIPWRQIAAGLVVAFAAALGADWWAEKRTEDVVARFNVRLDLDRALIAETTNRALETQLSGASVSWTNGDPSYQGQVTPIRTYRSRSGHWCREYLKTIVFEGREFEIFSLACRTDGDVWKTIQREPGDAALVNRL